MADQAAREAGLAAQEAAEEAAEQAGRALRARGIGYNYTLYKSYLSHHFPGLYPLLK